MSRQMPTPTGVAIVTLLTIQPIVGYAAANNYSIPNLRELALVAAGCLVVSLGAYLLALRWCTVDRQRIAPTVGVVAYLLLTPGTYLGPRAAEARFEALRAIAWAIIVVLIALLVSKLARFEWFRTAVLIFAVVITALPLVTLVSYRIGLRDSPTPVVAPLGPPLPEGSPNVYWIVLDEYARPDVVREQTGLDLTPFSSALTERGFAVSSSSTAAYTRTQQSIASTLVGDYLFDPAAGFTNEFVTAGEVLRGVNPTVDRFKASGYRFVYGDSGLTAWSTCEEPLADRCIPTVGGAFDASDVGVMFMETTSLVFTSLPDYERQDLDTVGDVLTEEAADDAPVFAFVHVMSPHWPYRYHDDCSERRPAPRFYGMSRPERQRLYAEQIVCLNDEVVALVDRIIAVDPDAVIVLQGDHGSSFGVNFHLQPDAWTPEALAERLAPFNAVRLPARCAHDDRYAIEAQPLVNTFRIVFACLDSTTPALLEPRAYLSSFDSVDDLVQVEVPRPVGG